MGRIKLVVFDLDGTLADTLPDIAGALEKVTAKYGAYGDLQQLVRKSIGNGARKLVERVFDALGISKENLEADLAEYRALYAKDSCIDTVLYPNTIKVLEELKKRGIMMTVATMKPLESTKEVLEKLGIADYFSLVLSADDMQAPKPDPWSVYTCAKHAGVLPEQALMIGDSMTDVGAGKASGAVSVAVLGGYSNREKMLSSGADYLVEEIGALLPILDELDER
ncbi:HAD-IA family hydrolase [Christensenellaceae bacterium 44-20]